ncbi:MAG: [acyl-carrier-protein] S-malonyltransferase [Zhongshania aliphaticivorans]|jgi:[acyl-carrier-protein] S-malonyltransferase
MALGLLFSGQGAQHVGMGRTLCENSETARMLYEEANEILDWDLKTLCFDGPNEALTETKVCQPALYVQGFALYKLLLEAGKLDDLQAACGLSLGELTALAVAGVYDFETGLKLVAERGRLMQLACESTEGGMAAVIGGSFEEVKTFCDEFDVEIANLNCPGQIVVSGEKAKVLKAVEGAKGRFKLCKPLNVAGAYHSRLMNPAKEAFAKFIETIEFKTPEIAVYTNVTGERVTDPQVIKEALASQIISPVRFEDCLRNMAAESKPDVLYECGPGKVLAGFGKRIDKALNIVPVSEFSDLPN